MGKSAMTGAAPIGGFRWWKASEYEVIGGTHVAPTEDADIQSYSPYDVYREFWAGRRRKDERPPPYAQLLRVDLSEPEEIAEWCRDHGLLGVLPHRTVEAYFWPFWKRGLQGSGGPATGATVSGQGFETQFPAQVQYRREHGGGEVRSQIFHDPHAEAGGLLTTEEIEDAQRGASFARSRIQPPGVQVERFWSGALERQSVAEGYAQFFPRRDRVVEWTAWLGDGDFLYSGPSPHLSSDLAESVEASLNRQTYPLPDSGEFRAQYGEPLLLFRYYARQLRESVRRWKRASQAATRREIREALAGPAGGRRSEFPVGFRAALRTVHPDARLTTGDDGSLQWEWWWQASSLYGLLNLMVLQDLPLRSSLVRECGGCGLPFVTDDTRQKYCSERCQNTAYMRRYRDKDGDDDES